MLYFLLIVSLGFYLVFLYYLTSIFVFIQSTSKRRPDGYRLVYRPATLNLSLSTLVESTMATVILGLAVCALMQAHAAYLQTADPSIVSFLTHDIGRIAKVLKLDALTGLEVAAPIPPSSDAAHFLEYQRQTAAKVMTVLPLAATILLSAAVSAYALFDAVGNSMAYCREKASDPKWLDEVGLTDEERKSIQSDTRLGALRAIVTPYGPGYLIGAFLLIISIITANFFVFLVSVVVIVAYRIIIKSIIKA